MAEMYNHHTVEKKWQKVWDSVTYTKRLYETKVLCVGRVPISIRTGTSRRTSKTIYGIGYRRKKTSYAGLQCTLPNGMGCFWSSNRELCDQK